MSRLDELIAELCPDGVEYKSIGSCVEKVSNIKWVNHRDEEYKYIDLTSVDRDTHQITETLSINADNAPSRAQQIVQENDVLLGATRPLLKRYCIIPGNYDGDICSTGFCVLRANTSIVFSRYLYHVISSTDFFSYVEKYQKGASYPAISDTDTKGYTFPVPPLEVQHEIVRILDNFMELIAVLTSELSSELTARKKQYEYYMDQLLSVDKNAKIKKIQDVCDISRGKVISKDDIRDNAGEYPVYSSQTENNGELGRISSFMYDGEYLTWTTDGANAGSIFYRNGKFNITNVCGLLKVKDISVDIRYLFHALTVEAPKYVSSGMGNPKLMSNVMGKIKIHFPSMPIQKQIAEVLDNFEPLCSDLNTDLQLEIEARKKQYEYYRDNLLTFKEKGA